MEKIPKAAEGESSGDLSTHDKAWAAPSWPGLCLGHDMLKLAQYFTHVFRGSLWWDGQGSTVYSGPSAHSSHLAPYLTLAPNRSRIWFCNMRRCLQEKENWREMWGKEYERSRKLGQPSRYSAPGFSQAALWDCVNTTLITNNIPSTDCWTICHLFLTRHDHLLLWFSAKKLPSLPSQLANSSSSSRPAHWSSSLDDLPSNTCSHSTCTHLAPTSFTLLWPSVTWSLLFLHLTFPK